MDDVLERLRSAAPQVLADEPVVAAYLFGSHARHSAGETSDVDIALLAPDATPGQRFDLTLRAPAAFARTADLGEVDVVVLDDAPLRLAGEVMRDGVAFYTADLDVRAAHESRIFRESVEFSVLTEELDRELLRLTAEGRR